MRNIAQLTVMATSVALLIGCGGGGQTSAEPSGINAISALQVGAVSAQISPTRLAQVTTLVGGAESENPNPIGLATDNSGNLYVAQWRDDEPDADNHVISNYYDTIRRIDTNNQESAFATGFSAPVGLALDKNLNLYVASTDDTVIYKIPLSTKVKSPLIDIPDSTPNAIYFDGNTGALYVADFFGSLHIISGGVNQTITFPSNSRPQGIALDSHGNILVTDYNLNKIWKITKSGSGFLVTSLSLSLNGQANLNQPFGIAIDKNDNIFVADQGNHVIRKVTPTGNVSTLAGVVGAPGTSDGDGSSARFNLPSGLAIDSFGYLYVSDYGSHKVRKVLVGTPLN